MGDYQHHVNRIDYRRQEQQQQKQQQQQQQQRQQQGGYCGAVDGGFAEFPLDEDDLEPALYGLVHATSSPEPNSPDGPPRGHSGQLYHARSAGSPAKNGGAGRVGQIHWFGRRGQVGGGLETEGEGGGGGGGRVEGGHETEAAAAVDIIQSADNVLDGIEMRLGLTT